jgi:hypothetical protein
MRRSLRGTPRERIGAERVVWLVEGEREVRSPFFLIYELHGIRF